MQENNARACKTCKLTKRRILDGYYPNKKNKRWRDEFGLEWNGNVCGSCNVSRAKEAKRKTSHG